LIWIPRQLNDYLKVRRVEECRQLLRTLEAAQREKFRPLVTGDESYFHLEYSHATKWCVCPNDAPPRVRTAIAYRKFIPTVIWGVTGFYVVDLVTTQRTFNSEYFVEQIMTPLVNKIYPGGRNPHTPGIQVHPDNYHVYFSK
jgi:hypothetical protein